MTDTQTAPAWLDVDELVDPAVRREIAELAAGFALVRRIVEPYAAHARVLATEVESRTCAVLADAKPLMEPSRWTEASDGIAALVSSVSGAEALSDELVVLRNLFEYAMGEVVFDDDDQDAPAAADTGLFAPALRAVVELLEAGDEGRAVVHTLVDALEEKRAADEATG